MFWLSRTYKVRGRVEEPTFEAKAKNSKKKFESKNQLFEDRPSPGQEQEWSRPRPRTKNTISPKIMVGKYSIKRESF